MDYKKKYNEALERANKYLYDTNKRMSTEFFEATERAMKEIFPELAECEDERIRTFLHHTFTAQYLCKDKLGKWHGEPVVNILAWIEKQGEHKHQYKSRPRYVGETELLGGQKPIDKVEPKFHKDEWITNGDYTWKIVEVKPLDYILQSQDGNVVDDTISYVDEQFHSFTIEDAKDGDVLKEDSCTFIIEKMNPNRTAIVHCCLFDDGEFDLTGLTLVFDVDSTHPATKGQRNLLFQKMKEAGYEWDAEKKELKKIEQKPAENEELTEFDKAVGVSIGTWNPKTPEQIQSVKAVSKKLLKLAKKQINYEQEVAWSEEDEKMLNDAIGAIGAADYYTYDDKQEIENWLKSLKDRVQLQSKQEWNEEEIENCAREAEDNNCIILAKHIRQLKSLRPQSTWKPSEEQIKVCKEVYADILSAKGFDLGTVNSELNRLEEELKKLKE